MKKEVRPIDANALAEKILEYMDDYPNACTRLAVCRTFLSMLGDEQQTPTLQTSQKAYDLGFGHLGNGITVWNRLEEVGGDYRRIAYITPDRKVRIYDDDMPQKVRDRIQQVAMTSDMTVHL